MEAWIVHIHEEWIDDVKSGDKYVDEDYSAWATEKQALKHAATWLREALDSPIRSIFTNRSDLMVAVRDLLDSDKIKTAINLVNKYTIAESPIHARVSGAKINIVRSNFQGSPFE